MNVFLCYENNARKSIKCLDDVRLNKQICESYELLSLATREEAEQMLKELQGEFK